MTTRFDSSGNTVEKSVFDGNYIVDVNVIEWAKTLSLVSGNSEWSNGTLNLRSNVLDSVEEFAKGFYPIWSTDGPDYDDFSALPNAYVDAYGDPGPFTDPTIVREEALRKFYSKLSNTDYLLAEYLLEMRKTVNAVNDSIRKLVKIASSLKRGRVGLITKHAPLTDEEFAKQWLGSQFMWAPLLSDIHNTINRVQTRSFGLHCKAVAKSGKMSNEKVFRASPLRYCSLEIDSSIFEDIRVTVKAKITPNTSVLNGYLSSIGISDPGVVGWNYLPFSFVVDWLYPVGQYFSALEAAGNWTISDASVTTTQRIRREDKGKMVVLPPHTYGCKGSGTIYLSRKVKQRTLGIPGVPPPRCNFSVDAWKVVTSISLLRTIFSR